MINLCTTDPMLSMLRASFPGLHVVLNPRDTIRPLTAVAVYSSWFSREPWTMELGHIRDILVESEELPEPLVGPYLAPRGGRTQKMQHQTGLRLLEAFLKPLGIDPQLFQSEFQGATQMRFSFRDVKRHHLSVGAIADALQGTELRPRAGQEGGSAATTDLFDLKARLVIVDSVLTASQFDVHFVDGAWAKMDVSVPLTEAVMRAGGSVQLAGDDQRTLTFTGGAELTYAFTALIAEINTYTRQIERVSPMTERMTLSGPGDRVPVVWPADLAAEIAPPGSARP